VFTATLLAFFICKKIALHVIIKQIVNSYFFMIETRKLSDEVNVKLTLIFPIIAFIAIISTVGIYFYSQKFIDRGTVFRH